MHGEWFVKIDKLRRHRYKSGLDLTPMVDIVFQLLIFFMVATTMEKNPQLRVDLPQASSATAEPSIDLVITIDRKGNIYADDQKVSWKVLALRLKALAARKPDALIVIRADSRVPHGRVVKVMDLASSYGLKRIAIATKYKRGGT